MVKRLLTRTTLMTPSSYRLAFLGGGRAALSPGWKLCG